MKRLFTFLFLNVMLCSVFSSLKAQVDLELSFFDPSITDLGDEMNKYWPPAAHQDPSSDVTYSYDTESGWEFICSNPSSCFSVAGNRWFTGEHKLWVTIDRSMFIPALDPDSTYWLKFEFDDPNTYLPTSPFHPDSVPSFYPKGYFIIADSVQIAPNVDHFTVPVTVRQLPEEYENHIAFMNTSVVADGVRRGGFNGFLFMLSNTFTYNIEYMRPTVYFEGKLDLHIEGGTNHLLRSLDGGYTWQPASAPITKSEIDKASEAGVIYIKEPWTYSYVEYRLDELPGTSPVMRPVFIPKVENAILNYPQGEAVYIQSSKNLVFTIKPTGNNAGKVPVIKTDRTSVPDSEGVLVEEIGDGSYKITIIHVQSAIKLSIDFTTGNDVIDNNNVWITNGQLYITAVTSGGVKIYNTAGSLVKTILMTAGETSRTALPAGFYVVSMNGKSHKVVVK